MSRADYKPGTLIDLAWCDGATVEVNTGYPGPGWREYQREYPPSHFALAEHLRIKPPTPTPEELRIQKNAETRKQWEAMEETNLHGVRKSGGKLYKAEWRCDVRTWTDNATCIPGREWIDKYEDNGAGYGIEYRITELPAPTITPWTFSTAPGCALKVRRKKDGVLFRVMFNPDRVWLVGNGAYNENMTYLELRDQFEQLDGTACGGGFRMSYHPDPVINGEVAAEVLESEKADLAAGFAPRRWRCECGAEHSRGHFGYIGGHRCLRCGYAGSGGIMLEPTEEKR